MPFNRGSVFARAAIQSTSARLCAASQPHSTKMNLLTRADARWPSQNPQAAWAGSERQVHPATRNENVRDSRNARANPRWIGNVADSFRFQIATRPGLLRRLINTTGHGAGMDKMFLQMRNVFEKNHVMPERDVIEQHQMLVQLAHVANMRNDRHAKFAAQQADGDKFAHARHPHRVHLNEAGAFRLQIIFENDAVGNMLAQRELGRRDRIRQSFVAEHIVGMRGFLNPERIDGSQSLADVQRLRQRPLLVGVHHHARAGRRQLPAQCWRGANRVRDRASRP